MKNKKNLQTIYNIVSIVVVAILVVFVVFKKDVKIKEKVILKEGAVDISKYPMDIEYIKIEENDKRKKVDKKGYVYDTFKMAGAPHIYTITFGEDIKNLSFAFVENFYVDEKSKNVEIIIKEEPIENGIMSRFVWKTRPIDFSMVNAIRIELYFDVKNIIIKNENGEIFNEY